MITVLLLVAVSVSQGSTLPQAPPVEDAVRAFYLALSAGDFPAIQTMTVNDEERQRLADLIKRKVVPLATRKLAQFSVTGTHQTGVEAEVDAIVDITGDGPKGTEKIITGDRVLLLVWTGERWRIRREMSKSLHIGITYAALKPTDWPAFESREPQVLTETIVTALRDEGIRLFQAGKYPDAETPLQAGIALATRLDADIKDRTLLGKLLNLLAAVACQKGNFTHASEINRTAQERAERENDTEGRIRGMEVHARILAQTDPWAALKEIDRIVEIREKAWREARTPQEKAKQAEAYANILNNHGIAQRHSGLMEQALLSFNKGIELDMARLGRAPESRNNKALVLGNQGDLSGAIREYLVALQELEAVENSRGSNPTMAAEIRSNIANLLHKTGRSDQALVYLVGVVEIHKRAGNWIALGRTLLNSATAQVQLGKYDEAEKSLQQAETVATQNGFHDQLVMIDRLRGQITEERGDHPKALDFFRRAQERLGRLAQLRSGSSDNLWTSNDGFELAAVAMGRAVALRQLGRIEEALNAAQEGLLAAELSQREPSRLMARTELARTLLVAGRLEEARREAAIAMAAVEKMHSLAPWDPDARIPFLENRIDPFLLAIAAAAEDGCAEDAFDVAERMKNGYLVDVVRGAPASASRFLCPEDLEREEQLRVLARRAPSEDQRAKAARERSELISRVLSNIRSPYIEGVPVRFADFLEPGSPLTSLARGDRAILSFVSLENRLLLFLIDDSALKDHRPAMFVVPLGRKNLKTRVETLLKLIADDDIRFQQSAGALYRDLLEPLRKRLTDKTQLLLLPDAELWKLPFGALRDSSGRYLIERAAISSTPSLTFIRDARRRVHVGSVADLNLFVIGDPHVRGDAARTLGASGPILYGRDQMDTAAASYPEPKVKTAGSDATKATFFRTAPRARVIQVITHGVSNPFEPLQSYIVLAGEDAEAARLEAREIAGMELKAEIVLFSACDLMLGRASRTEGAFGMTWASLAAGARTSVSALWKVDSRSTRNLMAEFHRLASAGSRTVRTSKSRMLQKAMLNALRHDPSPYAWAGFLLVGDPEWVKGSLGTDVPQNLKQEVEKKSPPQCE